jgi:hypothetical protein
MRFEVPQFIEVEDKIFGPFTWKQFIYLAGGAGVALIFFFVFPFILFVLFGLPVVALAGFLAFHQVNNRPFSFFLESVVQYLAGSKLYLWKKAEQQTITAKSAEPEPIDVYGLPAQTPTPIAPKGNIASLSRKLELNTLKK